MCHRQAPKCFSQSKIIESCTGGYGGFTRWSMTTLEWPFCLIRWLWIKLRIYKKNFASKRNSKILRINPQQVSAFITGGYNIYTTIIANSSSMTFLVISDPFQSMGHILIIYMVVIHTCCTSDKLVILIWIFISCLELIHLHFLLLLIADARRATFINILIK